MIHSASPQSRAAMIFRSISKFCDEWTYGQTDDMRKNNDYYRP